MKKRVNLITVAVLMALTGLLTYVVTYSFVSDDFSDQLEIYGSHRSELKTFFDTLDYIDNNFVGGTDRGTQAQGAAAGVVESLGDPWSRYFTPAEFEVYLANRKNSIAGIGIETDPEQTGYIYILRVIPGTGAEGAGLLPGDRITHVDGAAVAEIGYDAAAAMIAGEEFTSVKLTVERPSEGGGSFDADIVRQVIYVDTVTSTIIDGVGIIRIKNFNERSDADFIEHLQNLLDAGVTALVYDVRDNPGGELDKLIKILDRILPEGELVTLRDRSGQTEVYSSTAVESVDLPSVTLINKDSVSAAELFAADLKEFGWTTLVGEATGGKGYAQDTFRLDDGSGLYLSTMEYFTSKGISLDGIGLTPDREVLPAEGETPAFDPAADRQLAAALEVLTGR
ncbi:MAG: S41 family peptidase [Oscillospiraceae bacterium]|jgi:carboxyl-terminal processing protease|nr:S41 family peptidase [Oscillospiraceae bacterium]